MNTASPEEWQVLPGIGEKLSEAIVCYREKHRSFRKREEIMNVQGIGVKRFEAIQPHLYEIRAENQ
jgi:competence protein ComEA